MKPSRTAPQTEQDSEASLPFRERTRGQREGGGGGEEKPGDLMCLGFCQTQIVSVVKQKREAGGEEGSFAPRQNPPPDPSL